MTTLQDQLACAERELKMRQRVYPRWCDQGKMTREKATQETDAMAAIVETLRPLAAAEKLEQGGQLELL